MHDTQISFDLSIVIVNWNTRELLRDCLTSVSENLMDVSAEVIVVDNASEDGSTTMVAELFPDVILVRNQNNRGFAAANNQGFDIAQGRYVLLLNSDTVVLGNVLGESVKYLDDREDVGAMGCRVLNPDRSMQATCYSWPSLVNLSLMLSGLGKLPWPRFLGRYQMAHWLRDSERAVDTISGCYLLVRRSIIETVGPLDESFFFFGEETDWCRRMRDAGWTLNFAPVGEIIHHGGGSASKLNHKRDLMLTDAFVSLHRKHSGPAAATSIWLILAIFNSSRALYWSTIAAIRGRETDRERAHHFRNVVVGTFSGKT